MRRQRITAVAQPPVITARQPEQTRTPLQALNEKTQTALTVTSPHS